MLSDRDDFPSWLDLPIEFWLNEEVKEWLHEVGIL